MLGGRLLGDWLAGALGPVAALRAAGALAALGLASGLLVARPAAAIAAFAVLGAGLSIVVPLVFRAAAMAGGAISSGPSLAAVTTLGYLGFLAGPPLVGVLAQEISLRGALGAVALLAAAPAVLARAAAPGETPAVRHG